MTREPGTAALPALFIADLHISPERADITEAFVRFCDGPARSAAAVYILGDLFEVWIGDDDHGPTWDRAVAALTALTASGVAVYFLPGNRDFLLGSGFAQRTGITLLEPITLIMLHGERTLLLHGDELCTDDIEHQAFRREVQDPAWRAAFLARPLAERREIAAGMRAASRESVQAKAAATMDVNADAVAAVARSWQVTRIIHGHTHRPARHEHRIAGSRLERWVLGDWFDQGSMLVADAAGMRAVVLD